MRPENFEESIIWHCIVLTYFSYLLGAQYIVNTAIPFILLIYLLWQLWRQKRAGHFEYSIQFSWVVWVWLLSMLLIGMATAIGLSNFEYPNYFIFRELITWFRNWGNIALFILIGACLKIRPRLIYRAGCIVCLQSLFAIAICFTAYLANLSPFLYSSPLERITRNGKIYYDVLLYSKEVDSEGVRFSLFAPWAPALGLIACLYFIFALQETSPKWRFIGITGSILMIYASASRAAFITLPIVLCIVWLLVNLKRAYTQIVVGLLGFSLSLILGNFPNAYNEISSHFAGARKSSSLLRATLQRVALERWKEAPIWGHGVVNAGPPVLYGMPIGSHHTWVGLLFTRGIVGCFALIVPVTLTVVELSIRAHEFKIARVSLCLMLILLQFSIVDSLEILTYLYWPALIVIGMALRSLEEIT